MPMKSVNVNISKKNVFTSCPKDHKIWFLGQKVSRFESFIFLRINKNKHKAELQRTDPSTKVTGEYSTRVVFY